MPRPFRHAFALVAVLALFQSGCGFFDFDRPLASGARRLTIEVVNGSAHPVELSIAEDAGNHGGQLVGTAQPDRVGPGMTVDVEFTVPAGSAWAIFVDRDTNGPLILARDIPAEVLGTLPITIQVAADGSPSWSPDQPGWFEQ